MIYIIFILFLLYILIILKRLKKYKFNQTKDYQYNLEHNFSKKITIQNNKINYNVEQEETIFLKIELLFCFRTYFFKPFIKIDGQKHYFEYGAKGIRYLNLSHMKQGNIEKTNIRFKKESLHLYSFKNRNYIEDTITIIAPHADDAELAAFGLYKSAKKVTIVTVTAGENGVCNYCNLYKNKSLAALKKGELRAFNAITTPLLGEVEQTNCLALGYFGSSLQWMRENPNSCAKSHINTITSIDLFRKVSHSNIQLKSSVTPNYSSLKNDLREILLQTKPTIIVSPHPEIDSHPDHKESTYLIAELILEMNLQITLLLYTNHLTTSEIYPFGNMYSPITLPPNFKDFYFDSIYSLPLDKQLQKDKFFAIESMHDLRDSLVQLSIKKAYKFMLKLLKSKLFSKDKSYYRRAVRSNELFFVLQTQDTLKQLLQTKKA